MYTENMLSVVTLHRFTRFNILICYFVFYKTIFLSESFRSWRIKVLIKIKLLQKVSLSYACVQKLLFKFDETNVNATKAGQAEGG